MNLLLLTTHLNIGGVGVYTTNLAKYLKRLDVNVMVASSGGDLADVLARENIPHFQIDIKTKAELGSKVFRALPVLRKIVKENNIEIIHSQTRVAQVLGFFIEKLDKIPYVVTCHGFFNYKRLSRKLLPCWGTRTIAISKSVRKHLVEDFGVSTRKVDVVYNGIELDRYIKVTKIKDQDLIMHMGLDKESKIIGTVARLSSVKGLKYLVDAYKVVLEDYPNAQLVIVGEGPEEEALKKQVKSLGLVGRVFFDKGNYSRERYLSLFDVFCQYSINEGLGLSIMEAMASERACIASDVGGLAELIINGEDGMLVPPENAEHLSSAILRLLKDVGLRDYIAENARMKAQALFSIDKQIKKTMEVYYKLIKPKTVL